MYLDINITQYRISSKNIGKPNHLNVFGGKQMIDKIENYFKKYQNMKKKKVKQKKTKKKSQGRYGNKKICSRRCIVQKVQCA